MITFDNIHYTATVNGKSVTLQPLTFKLLESLAKTSGDIVAVDDLLTAVWGDVSVSAEALKQRIFLLRKELENSDITNLSIQAVRGEGYRLLIDTKPKMRFKSLLPRRLVGGIIAISMIMVIALVLFIWTTTNVAPLVNNRIVLWTNTPVNAMLVRSAAIYERWRSLLTEESHQGRMQLIHSERQVDMLLPVQARKSRAALVSYFEIITDDNLLVARLQIIEPTTATILRSDILDLSDDNASSGLLMEHLNGMQKLISSGQLFLKKEQRDNAKNPIWNKLRELAGRT